MKQHEKNINRSWKEERFPNVKITVRHFVEREVERQRRRRARSHPRSGAGLSHSRERDALGHVCHLVLRSPPCDSGGCGPPPRCHVYLNPPQTGKPIRGPVKSRWFTLNDLRVVWAQSNVVTEWTNKMIFIQQIGDGFCGSVILVWLKNSSLSGLFLSGWFFGRRVRSYFWMRPPRRQQRSRRSLTHTHQPPTCVCVCVCVCMEESRQLAQVAAAVYRARYKHRIPFLNRAVFILFIIFYVLNNNKNNVH